MAPERLRLRLDPEVKRKLAVLAEIRAAPMSVVVRELIDTAHADMGKQRQSAAAEGSVELHDQVPDPRELA